MGRIAEEPGNELIIEFVLVLRARLGVGRKTQ